MVIPGGIYRVVIEYLRVALVLKYLYPLDFLISRDQSQALKSTHVFVLELWPMVVEGRDA